MSETTAADVELAGWERVSDHCTQSCLRPSTNFNFLVYICETNLSEQMYIEHIKVYTV